jgi:Arm DNA-binding domain
MPVRLYLHTYARTDGRRPVYVDIRWGRGEASGEQESRLRTSTGQNCLPANWDATKELVKSAEPGYLKKNRKIGEARTTLERAIEQAELNGQELTPADLLALLKPASEKEAESPASPEPAVRTLADVYADWKTAYRARLASKTLSNPAPGPPVPG